jgi:methylated-DNA-[protein]-cysteine S-methyltransferase
MLTGQDDFLTAVYLVDQAHLHALPEHRSELLASAAEQLDAYFSGESTTFDLRLQPQGTDFQHEVWNALSRLPFGTTTTYGAIATCIGRPRAVRAVGLAIGANPLSIVVPCHRVIGANGSLTGYASGLDNKRFLLDHEMRVLRQSPLTS